MIRYNGSSTRARYNEVVETRPKSSLCRGLANNYFAVNIRVLCCATQPNALVVQLHPDLID